MGLAAFGALVLVYVVYTHFNRTPQVSPRDVEPPSEHRMEDLNTPLAEIAQGMKFDVGKTVTRQMDSQGNVSREMGFADWSVGKDDKRLWEVNDPFLNVFMLEFTCHVTAERGIIRWESDQQNPFPKDATFSGNVVIDFVPVTDSSFKASKIYLDEIVFISDESLFSSSGRIRFESDRIQLQGMGLECVYNDRVRRIEYFWIKHLDALNLKVPEEDLFSGLDPNLIRETTDAVANPVDVNDTPELSVERALASQFYTCRIRGNALVQSPQRVIYATETIDLADFYWPKSHPWRSIVDANGPSDTNQTSRAGFQDSVDEPNLVDVKITCDFGIMVAPDDVNTAIVDPCGITRLVPRTDWGDMIDDQAGSLFFQAQHLRHSVLKRDTQARGPLKLFFNADKDIEGLSSDGRIMPTTVSADVARHEAQANRILLSGDSRCTLVKPDPNIVERYALKAPRIAIDLVDDDDKEMQAITAKTRFKHMRADGGNVDLIVTKALPASGSDAVATEDLVSGVQMTCRECDYSRLSGREAFEALGPGQILLNNARGRPHPGQEASDSGQPFYAGLKDFEMLRYDIAENRIVAEGLNTPMVFHYFPIVDGQTDQNIKAHADHVVITLNKDDLDLESLVATGEVSYEDDRNQLHASGLSYDHKTQWIKMWSETDQPCFANGNPVTGIEFNLKTGEMKSTLPAMGSIAP